MDGNRRWATQHEKATDHGWKAGLEQVFTITEAAIAQNVSWLTFYAFSLDNWNRSQSEVSRLLKLLEHALTSRIDELVHNKVQLRVIGDTARYSPAIQKLFKKAEQATFVDEPSIRVNMALSYSGRWDILQATQQIAKRVQEHDFKIEDIDQNLFEEHLSMPEAGSVDLLIRTGNEQRISDFVIWQSAYAEYFFSHKMWPDFGEEDFKLALKAFANRERRFGD